MKNDSINRAKLPYSPFVTWEELQESRRSIKNSSISVEIKELFSSEVFTIEELGRYLKIGRNSAYDLIHAGMIHYVRIGKQIRIPKKAVEEFLLGRPCE